MSAGSALLLAMSLLTAQLQQSKPVTSGPISWGLTWGSPSDCIRPADLAERIERYRGGAALFGASPSLKLEGRVAREGAGWRARLTLVDKQGTVLGSRELESEQADCRAVDERLVVIASLLIDTAVAEPSPVVVPAPSPPPMPAADVPVVSVAPRVPTFELVDGRHFFDGEEVGLETFYRQLGRVDLVADLRGRRLKRVVGFSVGGLLATAGAVMLVAYAAGAGCSRYSGSPLLPGECLQRSDGLLVTSLIAVGSGALTLFFTALTDPNPTTLQQDAELVRAANAR